MNGRIDRLVSQPEGKTLEFKREISSPRNLLRTLVAFANSAGGRLVVGVDDSGNVVGVDNPLAEEERIGSMVADGIMPRLVPDVQLVTVEGKALLVVEVFPSGRRPHHVAVEGPTDGVYVRLGSSNRMADQGIVASLARSTQTFTFDELPLPELTAEDLDLDATAQLSADGHALLSEAQLLSLKLLTRDQGRVTPTHAGMLLFGRDIERYFPDARVQAARFLGADKSVFLEHTEFKLPLLKLPARIEEFLKEHAERGSQASRLGDDEMWPTLLTIMREVVINALVHADYSQRGAPLRVAYFDDRFEVTSPGLLMPGLTVEDMQAGISRIRNPVLARVFRELGLMDQWGSGVPRIFKDAKRLGLPEPVVTETVAGVQFTVFTLPADRIRAGGRFLSFEVGGHTGRIMQLLRNGPLSLHELSEQLGPDSRHLQLSLDKLLECGYIETDARFRSMSTATYYRLTPQGFSRAELVAKAGV